MKAINLLIAAGAAVLLAVSSLSPVSADGPRPPGWNKQLDISTYHTGVQRARPQDIAVANHQPDSSQIATLLVFEFPGE